MEGRVTDIEEKNKAIVWDVNKLEKRIDNIDILKEDIGKIKTDIEWIKKAVSK